MIKSRFIRGTWSTTVGGVVVVAAGAIALILVRQPTALETAAAAARSRCDARGWPANLKVRRYRDTSAGLMQGFQQEFHVAGTEPLMALWVEVRRPIYAPVWKVTKIIEVEADVDAD
jgi:hypothetical protein